jgi:RimJ/RimL family protein N-acetyltransferase
MNLIQTDRLLINKITIDDAAFVLELMNDKDWIKNVGDKGVRTIEDAQAYIQQRFIKTYQESNCGFYSLNIKNTHEIIGIAGLVDREGIDHIDIGYGILPEFRGKGYAFEATKAIYDYGYQELNLEKIVAIVNPDNLHSIKLLSKLGLEFEKMIRLPDEEIDILLYS